MEKELVKIIDEQTNILYENVKITLDSISEEQLDACLSDMPLWKHLYHMLHSLDQWFINPNQYTEPDFHGEGMNSMYVLSERKLSKADLERYFELIKAKNDRYLQGLQDNDLKDCPQNCKFSKLTLILGQYRHLMYHIGSLHGYLAGVTGKWPEYIGISPPLSGNKAD